MRYRLLLLTGLAFAQTAQAQVYEIGDGGAVKVREGGGAVVWRSPGTSGQDTPAAVLPGAAMTTVAMSSPVSSPVSSRADASRALEKIAARYAISPLLLDALVWQESRWNHRAVSPKGALGLTQLMPGTARDLGVDARDPLANLDGGARYLRMMLDRFGGDVVKALAAYNAGPERVERANGVPAIRETRNYVAAILARLNGAAR